MPLESVLKSHLAILVAISTSLVLLTYERHAEACGCLSPPAVDQGEFAVNQQSEQIIFEVEDGYVTAHVLIRYAGAPEQFAWIVPAPEVPEFALSPTSAFSILEQQTAPLVRNQVENVCPDQQYGCRYHSPAQCGSDNTSFPGDGDGDGDGDGPGFADAGAGNEPPPVVVLDETVIGSYQTVTFSAGDAGAAVAWLNAEGFVVNETMAPFMQPYADAGMVFVASKLVPGADVSAIKPLRMRYRAAAPMIPLKLTAVAAEPHMTVTAYVYGPTAFRVKDHPFVSIPEGALAVDPEGRSNYPMVLAKTIDRAGGDAFIAEYVGGPVEPNFDQGTGCCSGTTDTCNVGFDSLCQCPGTAFDEADCTEQAPDLQEGATLLHELARKHERLTRITTRLSAEEMTFDPAFEPSPAGFSGRLTLDARSKSLASCESDIIDTREYDRAKKTQQCASLYCGSGECAVTSEGAGCRCPLGEVAREFTDLDGRASVTCVSERAPVDLEAGGIDLPDACVQADCGEGGACVDVGGFPTCQCATGHAAVVGNAPGAPTCRPIEALVGSVGASDFSDTYEDILVCAPAAPECSEDGWLVELPNVERVGVQCSQPPSASEFEVPDRPTCSLIERLGCACNASNVGVGDAGAPLTVLLLGWFGFSIRRRRRQRSLREE